jgi:hypothetical protein
MDHVDLPVPDSGVDKRGPHSTRRTLLAIAPLVAVASVASLSVAAPARASNRTIECLADLRSI